MAGIKGKSGRHKGDVEREGFFFRLRPEVIDRVERCAPLLEIQEGVRMSKAEALEYLLTMACKALEGTREGREVAVSISGISEISSTQISKISDISGDDVSVPGYGFPEDPEDEEEIAAPASYTNGMHAPALPVDVPQAAETPAPAVQTAPAPRAKRPASHALPHETLQAIADEYTLCEGLSYSEFAQRLHDKGIYSATAKDGSKVPANRGNVKKWLDQARQGGLL